jgi:hypothetical protein
MIKIVPKYGKKTVKKINMCHPCVFDKNNKKINNQMKINNPIPGKASTWISSKINQIVLSNHFVSSFD